MTGQSFSIPHRESGANRNYSAARQSAKSTPSRDNHSRSNSNSNYIVKKEVNMVDYSFNLIANVEACFRTRLVAGALSACIAVAAAVGVPSGTQPYASYCR
jgi:hypothetical protein